MMLSMDAIKMWENSINWSVNWHNLLEENMAPRVSQNRVLVK